MRKDIGDADPTENTKFEVYASKALGPIQSVVQTQPILLEGGTGSFILNPKGTGLENVTWAYSGDGGKTWHDVTPGSPTKLLSDTHYVIVRAVMNPGTMISGFGITIDSEQSEDEDYFFTGKERDATGLYYFGARYYDPDVGRFMTEDPAQDGENWYGYCENDSINYLDPDGMKPVLIRDPVLGQIIHRIIESAYDPILRVGGAINVRTEVSIEDPITGEKLSSLKPDIVAYYGSFNEVYEIKQGMTWGKGRKYFEKGLKQMMRYTVLTGGRPGNKLGPLFNLPFPTLGPKAYINVYPGPDGMLYYYVDDGDNRVKKEKQFESKSVPFLERKETKYVAGGGAALAGGYAIYRVVKAIVAVALAPETGGGSLVLIVSP